MPESQQVNWWHVHQHVQRLLDQVGQWPVAGSPGWDRLDDTDPRKIAALYDAAQHHSLRVETAQAALAQASRDVSAAADWSAIAAEIRQRSEFYNARPWLRRKAS